MATSIIIGMGEVGRALKQVLSTAHTVVTYDSKHDVGSPVFSDDECKVMHVCIPFGELFNQAIKDYETVFEPTYTIIHSTTPVGTCKALDVHHSPIRGIHPHLAEAMTAFTTYLAPKNEELKRYLEAAGMDVKLVADTDTTEAGKLWSLAAYAMSIILEKEMYRWCEEHDVDYNIAYKHFTHSYNNGYDALGIGNYTRPVLEHMEGSIGGHCIMPGLEKLAGGSKLVRTLIYFNDNG